MQINGKTIVPPEIELIDFKAENIEGLQQCLITLDLLKIFKVLFIVLSTQKSNRLMVCSTFNQIINGEI